MNMRNTNVKSHTRVSKNGKQHQVHAHKRRVSFAERIKEGWGTPSARKAKGAAALTSLWAALWWMLSTSFSVGTAFVWAIILACLAVVSYVLLDKPDRRQARRKLRRKAAGKMQSKMKLWAHHRMMDFRPASQAPKLREKKVDPVDSGKSAGSASAKDRAKPARATSSFRTAGPKKKVSPKVS